MPTTEGGLRMMYDLTLMLDGYPGLEHSLPIYPLYAEGPPSCTQTINHDQRKSWSGSTHSRSWTSRSPGRCGTVAVRNVACGTITVPPDQGPTCSDSPLLTLPRAYRSLRVQFSQSNWATCQPGMFRGGVAAPAPETSLSSIPREKRRSTSGADQPLQALERLFREHYNGLCAFVRRYVGDSAVAEDVVQDVFVTLCGRSKAVELGAGMHTYLYRSARNAALNHLKHRRIVERKRRQVHLALSPSHASTDESARQKELAEAIESAVAELPERARLVFTLSREGGLTYGEIARTLDISKKAVEANLSRALAVLRKKLNIFLS